MAGVRVEGADRLRRTLRQAGDDLSDLKTAHSSAALIVAGAARARVPVRSGRLASSIRGSGSNTVATVRAGRASIPYAGPIHWGWPAHNIAPDPFLSDAATETEPLWTGRYEAAVERILDRIKGA